MNKRQSGFTLVEIAIVLVIIGLLLGGVLKGQEMIANAKYKNLRSDINSYSAAFYTFQDRYRGLPGDLSGANTKLGNAAAPSGNGAGTIGGGTCNGATDESCYVWQHLRYANLIPGDPATTGTAANPTHAYGGMVDGIYYATLGGRSAHFISISNVPSDVGQRLDQDLDDGVANTGSVICQGGGCGATYPAAGGTVQMRVML